ncbi:MAG: ParB/RepB/Spo0J family partition protein [Armatimonadota bacterium]
MLKRRSGLGSLIPGDDLTAVKAETVAINTIAVNPFQPRRMFEPAALEELAESIRRHGILQPLSVRPRDGGYELIAGERRLQASRKAGLTEVPVVVRECDDEEMLALALVENLQRENLNAMESARAYHQLVEQFGLSQGEVAERVGKSRSAVANTMRLLALPAKIQQAIEEGSISEGHGRAILAILGEQKQLDTFDSIVAKGLSVREVEALSQAKPKVTAQYKPAPKQTDDAHLQQVQSDLQNALSTKVRFKPGATLQKGVIEIEYYTAEDLERIYEALKP